MKKFILLAFTSIILNVFVSAQNQYSLNNYSLGGRSSKFLYPYSKDIIIITNSDSLNILNGNSASCNENGFHSNNGYWRKFDLSDAKYHITNDVNLIGADIGIESATGNSRTQKLTIKLYSLDGSFILENLTQIFSEDFFVETGTIDTLLHFDFTNPVMVSPNLTIVYEVFTPEGQTHGNSFFIGSNYYSQKDLSYVTAPDCGIIEPVSTADIGYGNMHIVMNLWGESVVNVDDLYSNISVFPNPSTGLFKINTYMRMKLEIFDITGKLLTTKSVNGSSEIELNTPGVYFLKFSDQSRSLIRRIIVN
jgi:hypothetical protein